MDDEEDGEDNVRETFAGDMAPAELQRIQFEEDEKERAEIEEMRRIIRAERAAAGETGSESV